MDLHNGDVLDKDVFDLNGHKIGHVTLAREDADGLISFDVEPFERSEIDVPRLTVPAEDVVSTDFTVSISEEARYLAHPERAPPRSGDEA